MPKKCFSKSPTYKVKINFSPFYGGIQKYNSQMITNFKNEHQGKFELKKKHNLEMKSSRESAQIHINKNILDNSTYSFWDKKFERKHIDFFYISLIINIQTSTQY